MNVYMEKLPDEESITIQTGQTYGKSANISKDIGEQIKKHIERIKEECDKNPDSLWSNGMRSFGVLDDCCRCNITGKGIAHDGRRKDCPLEVIVRCKDCVNYGYNRGEISNLCHKFDLYTIDSYSCGCGEKQVTGKLNNPDDSLLTWESKDCKEQKSKLYIPLNQHTVERINRLHKNACGDYFDEEWLYNELEQIAEILQLSPETSTNKVDTPTNTPTNISTDLISRQAVFYILENKMIDRPLASDRWVIRDIGNAIESLQPVDPELVSGDTISKEALIQYFLADCECKDRSEARAVTCSLDTMLELIDDAPPVEPERPRGEWNRLSHDTFHCTLCGHTFIVIQGGDAMNYCPNCGADMRGEEE